MPGNSEEPTTDWSPAELDRIDAVQELEVAVRRDDGTLRRWVPVWVVCADSRVYVRTWYRRDSGWFGGIVRTHRARIRARDVEADVVVEDAGEIDTECREAVDAAYRSKYGRFDTASVEKMVNGSAAATTLRLVRQKDDKEFL